MNTVLTIKHTISILTLSKEVNHQTCRNMLLGQHSFRLMQDNRHFREKCCPSGDRAMKNEKGDRRVRYTKMVIRESFLDLLQTKDISQISIKEICEKADINRATFYSHYQDPYDLMEKIEAQLFLNIEECINDYREKSADQTPVHLVERIFDYISENAKLCRLLLSERGNLNFQKRIMNLVYDKNLMEMTHGAGIPKEQAEYIDSFILTGCIGVIQKWLDEDMNKTPRYMAEFLIETNVRLAGFTRVS